MYPFAPPKTPARPRLTAIRLAVPLALLASVLAAPAVAQPPEPEAVHYVLSPQVATGRIHVELTWETRRRTQSAVTIAPQWGTVADIPALIRDLHFDGASATRTDKTRWLLNHASGAVVTCRYDIDPRRRNLAWEALYYPVTTRTFFHGMGTTFLLTPQTGGGLPEEYEVTLRWQLPEKWTAVCSWGTGPHVGALISPADLRNSVYLAGQLVTSTVKRDGLTVTAALLGRFAFEPEALAKMAQTIVAAQCTFMQEKDFPPFLITALAVGDPVKAGDTRLAGMGLYHSFALFAAPESELTDASVHLFAHELFHYWNGRILKAKPPDKLAYWFVEGFTDYYALRILLDSGYWPPAVYAKWINRHLREYAANPAVHATNADIAAHYWDQRGTVGEVAYQRGLLLGLRWHKLARDHHVAGGLDRLFFALVDRARTSSFEVSNEAIRKAGVELLGDWFADDFDRLVTQAQTIDVPADALAPAFTGRVGPTYEFELGFDRQRSLGEHRVIGLVPGSAAAQAGLRENDELLGWKIPGDPEEEVKLQILRAGKPTTGQPKTSSPHLDPPESDQPRTIAYFPRGKSREVLQFEPVPGDRRTRP